MARAHLKHNITRSGVGAIQNALIQLFLKGTSTPVSDAWDAEVGGSLITSVLSNAQGEIECWFDTPKYVDARITDNSKTAFVSGDTANLQDWSEFTETIPALPAPNELLAVVANSGITFTLSADGSTSASGGIVGQRFSRSATGLPVGTIVASAGQDIWSPWALDVASNDLIFGFDMTEPGFSGDVIRISTYDDDTTPTFGSGRGAKIVFSHSSSSPAGQASDFLFLGKHQFTGHFRHYDSAEGTGGVWIETYGDTKTGGANPGRRPSLLLTQSKPGMRTTSIEMGNAVGFALTVDPDKNDTQTFAITDLSNGLRRFNIRADGAFFYSTFVAVGAAPITTFAPDSGIHLKGNLVNNGGTSLTLENTGGQKFRLAAGITGVSESGYSLRNMTTGADHLVVTPTGNVRLANAGVLAANATDGFPRVPTIANNPSATPTAYGGSSDGHFTINAATGAWNYFVGGQWWHINGTVGAG